MAKQTFRKHPVTAAVALAGALALGAGGAWAVGTEAQGAGAGQAGAATMQKTLADSFHAASNLLDKDVNTSDGSPAGKISDLVLDKDGKVSYVLLSFDESLGKGDQLTVLPWDQVEFDPQRDHLALKVERDRLASAPTYSDKSAMDMSDPQWIAQVDDYWKGGVATARPSFGDIDADSDGVISRDEWQGSTDVDADFSAVDQNQDGNIDRSEFAAFEVESVEEVTPPVDSMERGVPGDMGQGGGM